MLLFLFIPYYSILFHIIPYYSISFHIIPYYSISFHIIPYYVLKIIIMIWNDIIVSQSIKIVLCNIGTQLRSIDRSYNFQVIPDQVSLVFFTRLTVESELLPTVNNVVFLIFPP